MTEVEVDLSTRALIATRLDALIRQNAVLQGQLQAERLRVVLLTEAIGSHMHRVGSCNSLASTCADDAQPLETSVTDIDSSRETRTSRYEAEPRVIRSQRRRLRHARVKKPSRRGERFSG